MHSTAEGDVNTSIIAPANSNSTVQVPSRYRPPVSLPLESLGQTLFAVRGPRSERHRGQLESKPS